MAYWCTFYVTLLRFNQELCRLFHRNLKINRKSAWKKGGKFHEKLYLFRLRLFHLFTTQKKKNVCFRRCREMRDEIFEFRKCCGGVCSRMEIISFWQMIHTKSGCNAHSHNWIWHECGTSMSMSNPTLFFFSSSSLTFHQIHLHTI